MSTAANRGGHYKELSMHKMAVPTLAARARKDRAVLEACAVPVGAGLPAMGRKADRVPTLKKPVIKRHYW